MDDLFAQYCMLIITAFTPNFFFVCFFFFCFQLGWGRPLCVYWGEGLKIIIPNFLMYCFFFFFGFYFTILSSDLRPPFGPMASWRLQVFCTLWWMLIGVFIIQSWMSFLVRSFLSLIPLPFRHHHCFLESQKTFHFGLLQKGPKCCSLHMKVLSPRHEVPARKRMNDRKKKKKNTLGTTQINSMKQYWKVGRGFFQIFLFFFFFVPTIILNKCHTIYQYKKT